MNKPTENLMVAVCDQVVFIKINGRGDFNCSLDLRKMFDELRQRGFRRFVLELRDCTMMDSTFLGLISSEALKSCDTSHPQPSLLELVNPNERITEVLENLGVTHLFKITDDPNPLVIGYKPLSRATEASKAEIARNCLEAHKTLMGINPNNVRKFQDVAKFLTEDLNRIESSGGK